jgi:hypothetical protein
VQVRARKLAQKYTSGPKSRKFKINTKAYDQKRPQRTLILSSQPKVVIRIPKNPIRFTHVVSQFWGGSALYFVDFLEAAIFFYTLAEKYRGPTGKSY